MLGVSWFIVILFLFLITKGIKEVPETLWFIINGLHYVVTAVVAITMVTQRALQSQVVEPDVDQMRVTLLGELRDEMRAEMEEHHQKRLELLKPEVDDSEDSLKEMAKEMELASVQARGPREVESEFALKCVQRRYSVPRRVGLGCSRKVRSHFEPMGQHRHQRS